MTPLTVRAGKGSDLKHIYESYDRAEYNILQDLKNSTGPIRLFFHIASQNIGLRGSLFSYNPRYCSQIKARNQGPSCGPELPLFASDRLISINKDPNRVLATLRHVNEFSREFEKIDQTSFRKRLHDYPFIWRLYGFSESLYLMPYFFKKDATKNSPVLVFEKKLPSMYHTFIDWLTMFGQKRGPVG